jgi:hypothetical protein
MKRILKDIVITRIAAVDKPCQEGAVATILKRDQSQDDPAAVKKHNELTERIVKNLILFPIQRAQQIGTAVDFDDAYKPLLADFRECVARDLLGRMLDALRRSLMSIISDQTMEDDAKLARIREAVGKFLNEATSEVPNALDQIGKSMDEGDHMRALEKRVSVAASLVNKFTHISKHLNGM